MLMSGVSMTPEALRHGVGYILQVRVGRWWCTP